MLESINNHWNEILSLIGAAAWIPIIFTPILHYFLHYFDRLYVTVLGVRILTNGVGRSVSQKEEKHGTIVMLVLNWYIKSTTFFAKEINTKIKLKSGDLLNSEILDFSTLTSFNDNGTKSVFDIPLEQEFNISRTIHKSCDNVRYISLLVENGNFTKIEDIEEIIFTFYYGKKHNKVSKKTVSIKYSDFPTFNSTRLIEKAERIIK